MDFKAGLEKNGMRTRSFRDEDYNNRRAFLRSYPLNWELGEGDDHHQNEEGSKSKSNTSNECRNNSSRKKPIKKIILSVFHWGGEKVLVLRRFKHKVTIYVISCIPLGFKPPPALISTT